MRAVGTVLTREENKAAWKQVEEGRQLRHNTGLRTRRESWARVRFPDGKELRVAPLSMVILKAPKAAEQHLRLFQGAVLSAQKPVQTESAVIRPRGENASFDVAQKKDRSTVVRVTSGEADVSDLKGRRQVIVSAGYETRISLDGVPTEPVKLQAEKPPGTTLDTSQLRAAGGDNPVAAYHLQIARDREFTQLLFDRSVDAFAKPKIDVQKIAQLPRGSYWLRAAIIDLFGGRGEFCNPRPYTVGAR